MKAIRGARSMAQALALNLSAHWQATAKSYLSRVSKAEIMKAVREAVSGQTAQNIAGLKKMAMAEAAERLLAGTGWLPVHLRTPQADEPNEAEALAVAAE